jgi:hypothetical protein
MKYRYALPIVVDHELNERGEIRLIAYRIRDRRNVCPSIVQWAIEEIWHFAGLRWVCNRAYGAPRPTFNLSVRPARIAVVG